MKKLIFIFGLLMTCSAMVQAQSKLSYSVLVNQSASTDDVIDVCIFRTTGGECIELEKVWKTNVTFNANYEVSPRLRLQSGLGYNVLSMDQLNDGLGTDEYKLKYLSIPIRAHYLINQGKVRFYVGGGLRTDIRLNGDIPYAVEAGVADNGRGIAVSLETLIGVEVPLSSRFKIHFEPTYANALTSYSKDVNVATFSPNILSRAVFGLVDEYPSRIGVSFGFTFGL
ncbi:MAG: hypothetical protein Roseis2KO_08070 [Roseivirga sp.]